MVPVYDLDINEHAEEKFAVHGVTTREVRQVLDTAPVFLPNKKGHPTPIVMIGPTYGGRFLTVPLSPVGEEEGVWRPRTAWESDTDEVTRYERAARQQ
jgi:hypothetical protein